MFKSAGPITAAKGQRNPAVQCDAGSVLSQVSPTDDTVTVSGPDRASLLAGLTVRFGRVEVVSEREVALANGSPGWELTVSHRPFIDNAGPAAPARQPARRRRFSRSTAPDGALAEAPAPAPVEPEP